MKGVGSVCQAELRGQDLCVGSSERRKASLSSFEYSLYYCVSRTVVLPLLISTTAGGYSVAFCVNSTTFELIFSARARGFLGWLGFDDGGLFVLVRVIIFFFFLSSAFRFYR